MKKTLLLLIFILLTINVYSQNINWGKPLTLKHAFYSHFFFQSGHFIGNIDGFDYYTIYNNSKSLLPTTTTDFTIFKAKNNNIVSVKELEKNKYDYITIQIIEDYIALFYVDKSNEYQFEIIVDIFNPKDLQLQKRISLFKYMPINDSQELIQFSKSENNNLFGILTTAINPEDKTASVIVKTFNDQYEEKEETYFIIDLDGENFLKDFILYNDGTALVTLIENTATAYTFNINKIILVQCKDGESAFITFLEENIHHIQDFSVIKTPSNKQKLFLVQENKIHIYDLSFKEEEKYTELNSFSIKKGSWSIDKILLLDNGNLFFSFTNSGRKRFESQNGHYTLKNFQSFNFICFNSELNNLIYQSKVGRYFSVIDRSVIYNERVNWSPLYVQKGNNVIIVYNSEMDYPTNYIKENGDDLTEIESDKTENINYQQTTIEESGHVETKTLSNSKIEKTGIYSSLCHKNDNETISIVKVNKKKLTIGTIPQ
jgi:hypothetical protein